MDFKTLQNKLIEIKNKGFVSSLRTGSTGVGYTFEQLLGVEENNLPLPDIGGRVEIKTVRKDAESLVTLFTFNKGVWQIKQKELILKYGYIDDKNRYALKATVFHSHPTPQGLILKTDENKNIISLVDSVENTILATWDVYVIVGKFMSKLSRLLLVLAQRKISESIEYFHYNEAFLLTDPDARNFLKAFKNNMIGIDLRMHLKENESVRNRGTAFRIKVSNFIDLYDNRKKLV
ncbi:MAG: MvaI/BcnI family restriction endonuclease [Verrucomicrobiia bacterium]